MRAGGTVKNTLKVGWNRKQGRGNKDFKRGGGGKLGQGVGALKRGRRLESPYELCLFRTYAKFSKKLTFRTPWYALNEWSLNMIPSCSWQLLVVEQGLINFQNVLVLIIPFVLNSLQTCFWKGTHLFLDFSKGARFQIKDQICSLTYFWYK